MHEPLHFRPIDMDSWPRKPYFDHYFSHVRCSYSLSCMLDITDMLQRCAQAHVKLYPAIVYCIAHAVNQIEESRVCFNEYAVLGTWNYMSPSYATFHQDDKTFSNIWTEYDPEFPVFHRAHMDDMEKYGDAKGLFPKPEQPDNCFTVSGVPWVTFTGFNINVFGDGTYLRPIFTMGKYSREQNKIVLPLAVQIHHAVCDGYHTSRLVNLIDETIRGCRTWLHVP